MRHVDVRLPPRGPQLQYSILNKYERSFLHRNWNLEHQLPRYLIDPASCSKTRALTDRISSSGRRQSPLITKVDETKCGDSTPFLSTFSPTKLLSRAPRSVESSYLVHSISPLSLHCGKCTRCLREREIREMGLAGCSHASVQSV